MASRVVIVLRGKTTRIDLRDGHSLTIGRGEDCDIVLDDNLVSRRHAILHGGACVEVQDLGSHNGTRILGESSGEQGETVTVPVAMRLEPGVRVRVDSTAVLQIGGASITLEAAEPPRGEAEPEAIVRDPEMVRLYKVAERVADSELSVLLLGESGVGKEVVARFVHARSPRSGRDLVSINCGAMPEHLLEAELFGYEKGAFTGATKTTKGILEVADRSTLFFDEVGELPAAFQVKLLRVLETNQFMRIGGRELLTSDVRYIAATNRDLAAEVAAGRFREDLYYRLNGFTLTIPPLRARRSEIAPLADVFLAEESRRQRTVPFTLTADAIAHLEAYDWPGNIRQLRNVIRRAAVLCTSSRIEIRHVERTGAAALAEPSSSTGRHERMRPGPTQPFQPTTVPSASPAASSPEDLRAQAEALEKQRILEALEACGGNQTRAATLLGITRRALVTRLNRYDIVRPRKGRTS